jgi:hypothetical protein
MKLRKLIGATLVSGALCLGLAACGDDASNACDGPLCQGDSVKKQACEQAFNLCVEESVNADECWAAAALACGNL